MGEPLVDPVRRQDGARLKASEGARRRREMVADCTDRQRRLPWCSLTYRAESVALFLVYMAKLREEFVSIVQQRGSAVIKARKQSSSRSAASAACDHMRDWILGTPKVQGCRWASAPMEATACPRGPLLLVPTDLRQGETICVLSFRPSD